MADTGRMRVEWNSESVRQVESALKDFGNQMRNDIVDKAIFRAAIAPLTLAQLKVPVDTGALKESLARRRAKDPNYIGTEIIARRTAGFKGGYHAHLVEFGHRIVIRTRNGLQQIGFQPPQPFIRPALEESKEDILSEVAIYTSKRVAQFKKKGR